MGHGLAEPAGVVPEDRPTGSAVRRALVQFALLSVVSVTLVSLATLAIAHQIAREKALDDARLQGAGIANRLAAPLVDEDVRAGAPGAADQLATVMANRMRDGSVRHVRIFDEEGVILWSEDPALVGKTFALPADVKELFGTQRAVADLTDLERARGVADGSEQELVEVYAGAFDRTGAPVVVEVYLPTGPIDKAAGTIVSSFVPLIVGSLLLLLLLLVPLSIAMSRRVHRAQTERATMMRHALLASDLERRRIAEDLHHGVVQELAGLGYVLPSLNHHLDEGDIGGARDLVDRATALVEHNVLSLRSLMAGIYPPDLGTGGLREGVQQLVYTEASRVGMQAHIRITEDLRLAPEAARLAYRVIREGLRNVVKHAGAGEVVIEVSTVGGDVLVQVLDDGRGPGEEPVRSPRGHLGLRLLTDTVRDFGGRLDVGARETGGTTLVAQFPATLIRS